MTTYFYTLSSTRDRNNIRYVGKTVRKLDYRLDAHICAARNAQLIKYTHNHNYNWINKELDEGYKIIIEEIDRCEDNWQFWEKYWICQFKCWGFKLNNISEGGDGVPGIKQSEEWIQKRIKHQIGVPKSEECRRKISEALKGRKLSSETISKVSRSIVNLQGRPVDQYDLEGNFIRSWEYIKLAASTLNIDESNLGACCKGKENHATAGGFIWRYSGDPAPKVDTSLYIIQLSLTGEYINTYKNPNEAALALNSKGTNIKRCCTEEFVQCNGYIFIYKKDFNDSYVKTRVSKVKTVGVKRRILALDLNGTVIGEFKNCTDAANSLNLDRKKIAKCCKGELESYKNFKFEYI